MVHDPERCRRHVPGDAAFTLDHERRENSDRVAEFIAPFGTVTRTSAQTKRSRQGALSGGHRRTCPLLGSLSSEEAERSAGDQVALEGEGVVDGGLNGEEALR